MKMKKILLIMLLIAIVVGLGYALSRSGNKKTENNGKMNLVASNFASYDFLRAIVGDSEKFNVDFLLGPGKDSHSYDPSAGDLIKIQNADLFVYVGGGMEKWSDKVLGAIEEPKKVICISDYVDKEDEEEIDGAEEEEEEEEEGAFNEHIWTSPSNAIKMVEILREKVIELDPENKDTYLANAENYINQIKEVDSKIQEVVDNKVRNRLVFGDKMPMQYFINYYKLKVSAAFSGCSTETEPSAATIAYLEKLVKEEKIPVVLYIELNNGRVAKTIADETGENCEALRIQSLHNVSLEDFNNGETWVSLMSRNIEVLKKALQ